MLPDLMNRVVCGMASNLVEEGIRALLEVAPAIAQHTNIAQDWYINIGNMLTSPVCQVSVRRTGGKAPNPKWNIDYPSVQVRVRGSANDYLGAAQKARDIKDRLLGLPSQDVNGDRWTAVNMIGDITPMPDDKNGNPEWVLNFALIIEPSVTGNRST
jgi:hypothetical protein